MRVHAMSFGIAPWPCVIDLSVSGPPPAPSEGLGPPDRKQKHGRYKPLHGRYKLLHGSYKPLPARVTERLLTRYGRALSVGILYRYLCGIYH